MDAIRKFSLALVVLVSLITANPVPDYSNENSDFSNHEDFVSKDLPLPLEEDEEHHEEDDQLTELDRLRRSVGETLEVAEQVHYNPFHYRHEITQNHPDAVPQASSPEYIFRGTPFGAVFVKHQSDANPHHKHQ